MTDPRCLDCKHCECIPGNVDQGICHLEPPEPLVVGMDPKGPPALAMTQRTVRLTTDYCSHFVVELIKASTNVPLSTVKH